MGYDRTLGIKIYLDEEHTQDTDIGLYTAAGESQIRLVENTFNGSLGAAETWKSGLLKRRAFSPIVESADLKKGGNVARNDTVNCTIINTSQYWKALADAEINIIGRRAEIWEFVKNRTTGLTTTYTMFYGIVTDPTWTETEYVIPVRDARFKRATDLSRGVEDSQGLRYPITFGYHSPDITGVNSLAEFFINASSEEFFEIESTEFDIGENDSGDLVVIQAPNNSVGFQTFPKTATDGSTEYTFQLTENFGGIIVGGVDVLSADVDFYFKDKYIYITEADGSDTQGQYRKITSATLTLGIAIFLTVEIESVLPTNDFTAVSIYTREFLYFGDSFPCGGFLPSSLSGAELTPTEALTPITDTNRVEAYVYSSNNRAEDGSALTVGPKDFYLLPIGSVRSYNSLTNAIRLIPKNLSKNGGSVTGVVIVPFLYQQKLNPSNLGDWGTLTNGVSGTDWVYVKPNIYTYDNSNGETSDLFGAESANFTWTDGGQDYAHIFNRDATGADGRYGIAIPYLPSAPVASRLKICA